ncbi:MAG: hypothetical protein RL454_626, partial [Actinomycetota bacterium]
MEFQSPEDSLPSGFITDEMSRQIAGRPPASGAWRDGDPAGDREFAPIAGLKLESGKELGVFRIAYESWGTLNEDSSNAVLVLHALTGDSHVIGNASKAHPTEGARVHMAHGPVGVVRQRVDRLDRHHRPLEGRHAVERQRDDQELQDRVVAQLVPRPRQRHDAVDHAAPARRQQHQREDHADALRPVGQRGVVQVVRAGPHVGEDQRPEVDDGQAVAVDGALGLLRNEVVHHPQEAGGQEEAHRVMAVPPLDHGILHARIGRVRLHPAGRDGGAVDQVQDRHGQDEGAVEPVGHVDVAHLAHADGA